MRLQLTIVALVVVVAASAAVAGAMVAVPADISWEEIRPYVEASIRVEIGDSGMTVGVSSAIQERALFEPYDPFKGELATVLLMKVLSDKTAGPILADLAGDMERHLPESVRPDRDELMAQYWEQVESDGRALDRAEVIYQRAQKKGRLRCLICDEGFEPAHLNVF